MGIIKIGIRERILGTEFFLGENPQFESLRTRPGLHTLDSFNNLLS